jgi:hypothetical protein
MSPSRLRSKSRSRRQTTSNTSFDPVVVISVLAFIVIVIASVFMALFSSSEDSAPSTPTLIIVQLANRSMDRDKLLHNAEEIVRKANRPGEIHIHVGVSFLDMLHQPSMPSHVTLHLVPSLSEIHSDTARLDHGVYYNQLMATLLRRLMQEDRVVAPCRLVVFPAPGTFALVHGWDSVLPGDGVGGGSGSGSGSGWTEEGGDRAEQITMYTWMATPTTTHASPPTTHSSTPTTTQTHASPPPAHLVIIPFNERAIMSQDESITYALASARECNLATIHAMDENDIEQNLILDRIDQERPRKWGDFADAMTDSFSEQLRNDEGTFPFMHHATMIVPSSSDLCASATVSDRVINLEGWMVPITSSLHASAVKGWLDRILQDRTDASVRIVRAADSKITIKAKVAALARGNVVDSLSSLVKVVIKHKLSSEASELVDTVQSLPMVGGPLQSWLSSPAQSDPERDEFAQLNHRRLEWRERGAGGRATAYEMATATLAWFALTPNQHLVPCPRSFMTGRYAWGVDALGSIVPAPQMTEFAKMLPGLIHPHRAPLWSNVLLFARLWERPPPTPSPPPPPTPHGPATAPRAPHAESRDEG